MKNHLDYTEISNLLSYIMKGRPDYFGDRKLGFISM